MQDKYYYEAYDDRYQAIHRQGAQRFGNESSPIVLDIIDKYNITQDSNLLEIGCGEGRDARVLLDKGFSLLATDISPTAVRFCQEKMPDYRDHFQVLDCIKDSLVQRFDFIYAVAVVHMLVLDEDRDAFYRFIYDHLTNEGIALICTMGDGIVERQSDIRTAFDLQERTHQGKTVLVAGTSCRMVNDDTFVEELTRNYLEIIERGQTCVPSDFPVMMYAVVRKARTV